MWRFVEAPRPRRGFALVCQLVRGGANLQRLGPVQDIWTEDIPIRPVATMGDLGSQSAKATMPGLMPAHAADEHFDNRIEQRVNGASLLPTILRESLAQHHGSRLVNASFASE